MGAGALGRAGAGRYPTLLKEEKEESAETRGCGGGVAASVESVKGSEGRVPKGDARQ